MCAGFRLGPLASDLGASAPCVPSTPRAARSSARSRSGRPRRVPASSMARSCPQATAGRPSWRRPRGQLDRLLLMRPASGSTPETVVHGVRAGRYAGGARAISATSQLTLVTATDGTCPLWRGLGDHCLQTSGSPLARDVPRCVCSHCPSGRQCPDTWSANWSRPDIRSLVSASGELLTRASVNRRVIDTSVAEPFPQPNALHIVVISHPPEVTCWSQEQPASSTR